jgi:hypothetical protein
MPLNESVRPVRRSHFTQQEIRDAERSIYGLPKDTMPRTQPNEPALSESEIQHMRHILARHDKGGGRKLREFDLNKPPVEPYRHEEYPKAMHNHVTRKTKDALDAAHEEELAGQGFQPEAFPNELPLEPALDAAEAAEVAALDKQARKKKAATA